MAKENTARAFRVREPGVGELVETPLRSPGSEEVRVRTLHTGISRGTEALVFLGRVPESQYEAMRCPFQEGDFPGPVKYGYMNVGVVEEVGPGVGRTEVRPGRRVFTLFPHQDHFVVPAEAVDPIPDAVPSGRAILAANLQTALTGVWDGGISLGDRVLVVGGGVVGCLAARLAGRIPGARVVLVDPDESRAGVAEALGVAYSSSPPPGFEADVVLHASGNPAGAVDALGALGVEGRLVELSWFGDRDVSLPLGGNFHSRRLTLRSSQVGRIPPERAPRWDFRRRSELVMRLLEDEALDLLIDGPSDFEALPETMARLAGEGTGTLCHRVDYPG